MDCLLRKLKQIEVSKVDSGNPTYGVSAACCATLSANLLRPLRPQPPKHSIKLFARHKMRKEQFAKNPPRAVRARLTMIPYSPECIFTVASLW